jgi:hypothetical protein
MAHKGGISCILVPNPLRNLMCVEIVLKNLDSLFQTDIA